MVELLVLFGSVLGSATVAAILSNWWQARRLQAEALHNEYRSLVESLGRLTASAARVIGMLRAESRHPNIWDYQREQCEASMQEAHQTNFEVSSKVVILSALEPDLQKQASAVSERGFDLVSSLSNIQGWMPNPEITNGIRTLVATGESHDSVADKLTSHVESVQIAAATLMASVAAQRKNLLTTRVRSRRSIAASALAGVLVVAVLGAGALWFATFPTVFSDRVVWVNRLNGSIHVEWIVPPITETRDREPARTKAAPDSSSTNSSADSL